MREALTIVQVIHILSDIVASGSKKPGLESHFFLLEIIIEYKNLLSVDKSLGECHCVWDGCYGGIYY